MKVLHLGKYYTPIEGGIESINKVVVESLKGHQQKVLSFNSANESRVDDVDNVEVYRCATYGVLKSQPISIKYFWELGNLIKKFRPDIIHFHYPNPLAALYLILLIRKNTKLIVHWHSDVVNQDKLQKIIEPLENKLLSRADRIIATSENYRDNSISLKNFKDKVTIIPCSIDESHFEISEEDACRVKELKAKYQNKPIVLFLGRHVEYKGLKYLLEANRYVTADYHLLIGGRGPLTEELKQTSNDSERVHWLGRIPEEDMRIYYHAADILAFPSITKNEAFGVVLAEAMYCNTPAVTFTIKGSGVNWVAPDGIASLEVENRNSKEYAKALESLLTDKSLRESLGAGGRERIVNLFSKNKVEKLYRQLYNELIKS